MFKKAWKKFLTRRFNESANQSDMMNKINEMSASVSGNMQEILACQILYYSNKDKVFAFNHFFDRDQPLYYGRKYKQCGEIKFYLPYALSDWIQAIILRTKDFYGIEGLEKVDKYIPKNAQILDIGANIGNHSIYWAMVKGAARIYAFEPIKETYEMLCKNITLNNLQEKIQTFNFALGAKQSQGSIKEFHIDNAGGTSIQNDEAGEIVIQSLDELEKRGVFTQKIDFVKIDVECFEDEVLRGGGVLLCPTQTHYNDRNFPASISQSA
uniref:Methyltransferase FkbM domain-containing protein n=1 Tax=uncultured Helicobacter sp. TaxID=175537 RepID=A0A650EL18_9HELI|nr:hypothetical protein Helico5904_1420 [uncultured Helicobacter sp.]